MVPSALMPMIEWWGFKRGRTRRASVTTPVSANTWRGQAHSPIGATVFPVSNSRVQVFFSFAFTSTSSSCASPL